MLRANLNIQSFGLICILIFSSIFSTTTSSIQLSSTIKTIRPYTWLQITINASLLALQNSNNSTYSMQVYCDSSLSATSGSTKMIYDGIFYSSISGALLSYVVWNYEQNTVNIEIRINGIVSTFFQNAMKISLGNTNSNHYVSIFTASYSNGYMLPFNLLKPSMPKIIVSQTNSSTLSIQNYTNPNFMPTYWNQIQKNSIILPFLPFFSSCTISKPYIMLDQIIYPQDCSIDNSFGKSSLNCNDKSFKFQCVVEQLSVVNVINEYWFNTIQGVIYFLIPKAISTDELISYSSDSTITDGLVRKYYSDLVPVIYYRTSTDSVIVNQFDIHFNVRIQTDYTYTIISANILGTYQSTTAASNLALVNVNVRYINGFQNLLYFESPTYMYVLIIGAIVIVLCMVLKLCEFKVQTVKIKQNIERIVFPIIKGFILSTISAWVFIVVMYEICASGGLNGIYATFVGNLTGDALIFNNKGRSGLMLMFVGMFVLNSGIHQTFKVVSPDEAKLIMEDEREESGQVEESSIKEEMIIKSMNNHRSYLFIQSLLICLFTLYSYFMTQQLNTKIISLTILIFLPFFTNVFINQGRQYILKDLLYFQAIYVVFYASAAISFFRSKSLDQMLMIYSSLYLTSYLIDPALDILIDYLVRKIRQNPHKNIIYVILYKMFNKSIEESRKRSQYERNLYYSALMTAKILVCFFKPLLLYTVVITIDTNYIIDQLFCQKKHMLLIIGILILMIPFQLYSIFMVMKFMKRYGRVDIDHVIQFNQFKFKKRKVKWLSDLFNQNRYIAPFYREFEKYLFSSQLYFVNFLLAHGIMWTAFGMKIIISSSYLPYNDPILFIMLALVWIFGYIASALLSFIVMKLKIYQIKQEETIRLKLNKVQKYLKIVDYTTYLSLPAVKDYFLMFNMNWIVHHLNAFLLKEDFQQNDHFIINQYKSFKSGRKRLQIQHNKKINQMQKQHNQEMKQFSKNKNKQLSVIEINKQKCNLYAKPMLYQWFYIAKQNLYLKSLIQRVKQQKIKQLCQFCNMDFELEAIEKKDFQQIVNSYRVVNVGRIFVERQFLEFYRINQNFITICIQCKDKKLHLEKKVVTNVKGPARKLMLRWLLLARSKKLHHGSKNQKMNDFHQ